MGGRKIVTRKEDTKKTRPSRHNRSDVGLNSQKQWKHVHVSARKGSSTERGSGNNHIPITEKLFLTDNFSHRKNQFCVFYFPKESH